MHSPRLTWRKRKVTQKLHSYLRMWTRTHIHAHTHLTSFAKRKYTSVLIDCILNKGHLVSDEHLWKTRGSPSQPGIADEQSLKCCGATSSPHSVDRKLIKVPGNTAEHHNSLAGWEYPTSVLRCALTQFTYVCTEIFALKIVRKNTVSSEA